MEKTENKNSFEQQLSTILSGVVIFAEGLSLRWLVSTLELPFYFIAKQGIDIFFKLPQVYVSIFDEDDRHIRNKISIMRENNLFHLEKEFIMEDIESTQFIDFKYKLERTPFSYLLRDEPSVPIVEREIMCVTTTLMDFVKLGVFYVCVDMVSVDAEHLKLSFMSYENDILSCLTEMSVAYDKATKRLKIRIEKTGYVILGQYGVFSQFVFNADFFREKYEELLLIDEAHFMSLL